MIMGYLWSFKMAHQLSQKQSTLLTLLFLVFSNIHNNFTSDQQKLTGQYNIFIGSVFRRGEEASRKKGKRKEVQELTMKNI